MRETSPAAMPPCFDKWCQRFDDLLRTKAQKRKLNYLGGLAKNRKVQVLNSTEFQEKIRLDVLAEFLPESAFTPTTINLEKAKTVWVTYNIR
ncbi:hypothetical protein H1P_2450012 [Hyella patelloides LEGE 07179]|uniref:Transposase n=1 Tax=Hyella patelloides LEGE 07179 TaxID=945734 RepID=A0A563VRX8_9CYAN|nr:hypothetical protein H1P_2450012 [Hyella patelloides LEGE 07179]